MNKKFKIQAITLLAISVLLCPSIYILLYGADPNDESGLQKTINYIFLPLPAFISVMCFIFGLGRLHAAITYKSTLSNVNEMRKQQKRNYIALSIVTVLLGIIGLAMLAYLVYALFIAGDILLFLFTGAIPMCILIFSLVMIPMNIKNLRKQKRAFDQ